jgi:hypothetical protein
MKPVKLDKIFSLFYYMLVCRFMHTVGEVVNEGKSKSF